MGATCQPRPPFSESFLRRGQFTDQHHFDEPGTGSQGHELEPFDEVDPAQELRNDDVVVLSEVRLDQGDRQIAGYRPRFRPLLPLSKLRPKKIDVDDEREGTPFREFLGER
jgi:hypothetical protein